MFKNKHEGKGNMGQRNKKQDTNKKVPIIMLLIFVSAIMISFLYSLIQLIIKPSNMFIIEERKYLSRRDNLPDIL